MAKFFKVRNLERFQHYKRRNPPWIKLHTLLLEDYEFEALSDAGKWHLVAIWLLASRKENRLPWDQSWLAKKIPTKTKINLEELEKLGFIECYQDASGTLAECKQDADSERETEQRERQSRVEGEEIAPSGAQVKSKKGSQFPDDFTPTEDMIAWAISLGVPDPGKETEAFEDYHRSKGTLFKDWNSGWRTWMRNTKKFERKPYGGKPTESDKIRRNLASIGEFQRDLERERIRNGTGEAIPPLSQPGIEPREKPSVVRDVEGFD